MADGWRGGEIDNTKWLFADAGKGNGITGNGNKRTSRKSRKLTEYFSLVFRLYVGE
jgi:hypothetical protein